MWKEGNPPNSCYEVSVTLISKAEFWNHDKEEVHYMSILLTNIDVKILHKTLASRIQQYVKKYFYDQVDDNSINARMDSQIRRPNNQSY